tara:strand:+ start:1159 stop:1578 length:420 start_codon:yes stop_codon:yes gene_type:complete
MPLNLIRSLIDVFTSKHDEQSSLLDKLSKRKIIQTVNECGEKRYIEIEKEYPEMKKEQVDYLYTRCKSLLHFVNKRGVLQTSDDDLELLYMFTTKIKHIHDNINHNVDDLYDEFKSIEKRIKGKTNSFRDLSHCNLEHM